MNIEQIREYCLLKDDSFDCFPFDDDALTFKVTLRNGKAKMFAVILLSRPNYLILKCDPERAIELRERHVEIEAVYHFNKSHWNGVIIDGSLSICFIKELIDHSYTLVKGVKKR